MALLLGTLALAACTDEGVTDEQHDVEDIDVEQRVVDIAHTVVKRQSIGNCWVYASIGWAESLRLTHSGEALDLSESWISYWHWYEELVGSANPQPPIDQLAGGKLSTGGWWGVAGEIMLRYGVIDEGGFIAEEADEARSQRQFDALAAIEASLASGVLSDPQNRMNRTLVRQQLDDAWNLSPSVRSMLDSVFGADVSHTLYETRTIPQGSGLRYASSIGVGVDADDPTHPITLADAVGQPSSWSNISQRVGPHAWNDEWYPYSASGRREQMRQMQKALHARLPVVMSWFVDFNAMGNDGAFRAPPTEPGRQGGHMTALEDYEVENVPGYGTLEAGTVVEDPAALEAALDEQAHIKFIRVKNSWGTHLAPPEGVADFAGYHDIYSEYFDGTLQYCTGTGSDPCVTTAPATGLWTFVLPPASFSSELPLPAVCQAHDSCTTGVALVAACGDCVSQICAADPYCCNNQWDDLCVDQVASVCGDQSCSPTSNACAHDKCVQGEKLAADCDDPCVAQVCAADAYCCTNAWDSICVGEVASICGATCN